MKYLVMECGLSYAVVMDSQGEFFKVPNLGYEVGQTLEHVVLPTKSLPSIRLQKQLAQWAVTAACLCMLLFGGWQFWKAPAGTVRMQINPDVQLTLNRFDRVLQLEGLNQDGVDLINGLSYFGQKVQDVSNQLATRAMEMGYLEQGGQIVLTAESDQAEWTTNMEEQLQQELTIYLERQIEISIYHYSPEDPIITPAADIPSTKPVDDTKGSHSYQDKDDDDDDLDDEEEGDDEDDDDEDDNDQDNDSDDDREGDDDLKQDDDSHEEDDDSDDDRDSSRDSDSDEEDQENDNRRSTAPRSNDDPDDDDDPPSQDRDSDEDEGNDLEDEDDDSEDEDDPE